MNRMWVGIGMVACAVAAVLLTLLVNKPPQAAAPPDAIQAAEPKERKAAAVVTWEYGTERLPAPQSPWSIRSYRLLRAGEADATYGVRLKFGDTERWQQVLPVEGASSLVLFYERHMNAKVSKALEIQAAFVRWTGTTLDGEPAVVKFELRAGQWYYREEQIDAVEFFKAIKLSIEDCKAMKEIPFSVTP